MKNAWLDGQFFPSSCADVITQLCDKTKNKNKATCKVLENLQHKSDDSTSLCVSSKEAETPTNFETQSRDSLTVIVQQAATSSCSSVRLYFKSCWIEDDCFRSVDQRHSWKDFALEAHTRQCIHLFFFFLKATIPAKASNQCCMFKHLDHRQRLTVV